MNDSTLMIFEEKTTIVGEMFGDEDLEIKIEDSMASV
jgi:hypothetical protein